EDLILELLSFCFLVPNVPNDFPFYGFHNFVSLSVSLFEIVAGEAGRLRLSASLQGWPIPGKNFILPIAFLRFGRYKALTLLYSPIHFRLRLYTIKPYITLTCFGPPHPDPMRDATHRPHRPTLLPRRGEGTTGVSTPLPGHDSGRPGAGAGVRVAAGHARDEGSNRRDMARHRPLTSLPPPG